MFKDDPCEYPWINPIGGAGDMLMVSGVMKTVWDLDHNQRFNVVRRTHYPQFFRNHPAIVSIGNPPSSAEIKNITYWSLEPTGPGIQRPYQILARHFGLKTPVEEELFFPLSDTDDTILVNAIPWKRKNVLIAPVSDSPRKMMKTETWEVLVKLLKKEDIFVVQTGRFSERAIPGAYSIIGLTTLSQLFKLLPRFDIVITLDNLLMHAAHMMNVPALVLWGATSHLVYGYPEQTHIQSKKSCGLMQDDECIGYKYSKGGKLYTTPCPQAERHCLDSLSAEEIFVKAMDLL